MTMTDDEIARLRELLEKADDRLELPLRYDASLSLIVLPPFGCVEAPIAEIIKDNLLPGIDPASCDVLGDLFVAAVNALPSLLAERDRLRGQVEAMREKFQREAGGAEERAWKLNIKEERDRHLILIGRSQAFRDALAAIGETTNGK